jgi:hypothetical protein
LPPNESHPKSCENHAKASFKIHVEATATQTQKSVQFQKKEKTHIQVSYSGELFLTNSEVLEMERIEEEGPQVE